MHPLLKLLEGVGALMEAAPPDVQERIELLFGAQMGSNGTLLTPIVSSDGAYYLAVIVPNEGALKLVAKMEFESPEAIVFCGENVKVGTPHANTH